ncbi:MAG: HAD family hydrolase, partial [Firmicutes bacterium]|nr:HAD family hydrolase [Bacillota bacterium]
LLLPDETKETALKIMDEISIEECVYLAEYGGQLYGDVRTVMETLKENNHRLFIVSNCQSGYIQAVLKYHQLGDLFEDYEMSGQTGLPKSENIRLIIERNHIKSAVYVGDTEGDENAAHTAGIPFIHAAYGFGAAQNPEGTIRNLSDLINKN